MASNSARRTLGRAGTVGFTLLEVMISTSILLVIVGAAFSVTLFGSREAGEGQVYASLGDHARRGLDEMATELVGAGLSTLTPTPPAADPGSTTLGFKKNPTVQGGALVWGNTITYMFQNGQILRVEDLGGGASRTRVLVPWVSAGGFSVKLNGKVLSIRVQVERQGPNRRVLRASLETSVQVRN